MKRHVSSVHRPPLWIGYACLALAVLLLSSPIAGRRAAAFGGLSDEAIIVWQHRDSASATGWDIWYSVVGRATSGGSLSLHAGTITGTQAAPIATPSGDDKNPHVSTNAGVTIAAWQHHHTNSTDIFYSTLTVVDGVPTWSTPAAITPASSSEHNFDPNVAVDSNGNAIAVWVHQHSTGTREMQYSVFNGTTWSAPASIGASGGEASLPEVTVSSVSSVTGSLLAHRAVAAWSDVPAAVAPNHRMFYSTFTGTSWTAPAEIESSTTGVGVSISDVVFANYSATDPDPFGAFGRVGVTADGFGKAYVVWSGGPTILGFFSLGVVGAILDVSVSANTWTAMLTPSNSRFIGIGGCENPADALTTGGGDFIGVFNFAGFIEHTRRVSGAFTVESFSYSSARNDQRPSNAAVSATEMISVNWGAPVGPGSTIVWAVGTPTSGGVSWGPTFPDGTSGNVVSVTGENMFPAIASGFATSLVTGFSLAPGTATNPVGTSHTVTATAILNGVAQSEITVTFTVTGANTASGSLMTNSAGQAPFTYTGTTAGTDTITATATIGGTPQTATASTTWTAAAADDIAPTTTTARSPAPNAAGWNNTDVTVTFTATDFAPTGVTPSGVASITVTDKGVSVPCSLTSTSAGSTCTVVFSTEGHHHVSYFATDIAGNAEITKMLDVMIDKTAPVANSQSVTTDEDTAKLITLTGSDDLNGSGLASFSLVGLPLNGTLTGTPPNLTYTPFPNFFGADSFTFTVTDLAGNTSSTAVVSINVTAFNDAPFFDPIARQTVIEPEAVMISGVTPGPNEETVQTATLTATTPATTPDTTLITNLAITPMTAGGVTTRTLTYQRFVNANGTTNAGTATVTVTAKDGQPMNNTFSQSFTITLANASGDLTASVGGASAPASPTGFVPGEPVVVSVDFTFPTIDFNGDGMADCYRVIPPNSNVIPRVDGQDATQIPEGLILTISDSLPQVCGQPLTLSTQVPLTDWYPDLLQAEGTHNFTLTYVNFAHDPEETLRILQATSQVSGSVTIGDQCPGDPFQFGAGAGGTGCPVADKNTVTLHIVNLGGGPSTKAPLAGAVVRVFDRNSPAFRAVVAALTGTDPANPANKNPDGSLYGLIFEANQGVVGTCYTDSTGVCFAGEAQVGDYLVIVKKHFADTEKTVYAGRPKSPTDFVNGVAEKDFQIIKVLKQGVFQGYRSASKIVVTGSILEMIVPESAIWEGTQSIYPFIFVSDTTWTVDVCAQVPAGYLIVGVYDEYGNLIGSTNCAQAIVAGQTKVVAFEVVKTGSPEPSLDAEVRVKGPSGKSEVHKVKASDIRRESFDAKVRETKGKK